METKEKLEINVEKLQNQVRRELLAEEKYQRENSAKLRAVEQRVPTYEDFRQIVLASHLKPLDRGESLGNNLKTSPKVWNSAANDYQSDLPTKQTSIDVKNEAILNSMPKSNLEFIKIWKQIEQAGLDSDAKWRFLTSLGSSKLKELFQMEINGDMLGKFLILFNERLELGEKTRNNDSTEFIAEMMQIFTKCNRFNLNVMFLSRNEVEICKNVFKCLESSGFKLEEVKKLYF